MPSNTPKWIKIKSFRKSIHKVIVEIPNRSPFNNIRKWLFDKKKSVTINPIKPSKKKVIKELKLDGNNLLKVVTTTHGPDGKINQIIRELNKLKDLFERLDILDGNDLILDINIQRLERLIEINKGTHRTELDTHVDIYDDHVDDFDGHVDIFEDHRHRQYTQTYPRHLGGFNREPIENRKYTYTPYTDEWKIHQPGYPEGQSMQRGGNVTGPIPTNKKDFKQMLIDQIQDLQNFNLRKSGGPSTRPVTTKKKDFKQMLIDDILDIQNNG